MRVKLLIIAQVLISVLSCGNSMNNNIKENKNESKNTIYKNEVKEKMKIVMKVNGKIYNVELLNTRAAKDFYNLLPVKMKLTDYAGAEKVSELGKKFDLDISDSPKASAGKSGDISLYAPWGNIAIFYNNGPHALGLVKLGHIVEGGKWLEEYKNDFEVTFEKIER